MLAAILDHVWQSTWFAAGAYVIARALRKDAARLRHFVWFAASLKFLVPFSLLAYIGVLFAPQAIGELSGTSTLELRRIVDVLVMPASTESVNGSGVGPLIYWVGAIWSLGCIALAARWWVQWSRVRALIRSAVASGEHQALPILTSPSVGEPGVVGIFSPVLLLPEGIADRLTPVQLWAVLDHEVCHVRRRDNLTAAMHMLVEALFWFHPLVWWIGARLVEERERACDESVLRIGHEPRAYAEGILKVCQSRVTANPNLVAGVTGADLKARLEDIMTNDVSIRLSRGKRWMLGMAATAALAIPLLLGVTAPATVHAEAAKSSGAPSANVELLTGKRVKLDFDRVEVRALLLGLAKAAGVNMLVSDQVGGDITVHLAEMPWDQALSIVLQSQGLARRESNGIIFVEPATATAGG